MLTENGQTRITNQKIIYDENEHLRELIKEIVIYHQEDGYDNFEKISQFLREKNTKLDNFEYIHPKKVQKNVIDMTEQEKKSIYSQIKNSEQSKIKLIQNYMEDILAQSQLLEWGGVSFNELEWYKIRTAAKKLLIENNCEFIRFFGKRNYPMTNPQVHVETRGNEGINRYTFWVSNSPMEIWHELPDITPEQLVISRRFKYYFTGDLNSKVKSFIYFPGKEMHLLKCQIVRILHSSCIVPKGYLKLSENFKEQLEGKVTEYDEEFKSPSFDEMKGPEGEAWTHEHAYIYPNGKVIDPSIETQVERLKGINEDEGYKIKEGEGENINEIDMKYWKIKVVGDNMMHNRANGDPITHAVVLVKNTRWPGTLTVWKEEKFCNIYVGFGIKAIDSNYFPTQIDKMDKDPNDLEEQKEPFPEKEPPKPEEKKEGEEQEGQEGQGNEEEKKEENEEE